MNPVVRIAEAASDALKTMDRGLVEELIQRVAVMVERPMEVLRRSGPHDGFAGLLVLEYSSECLEGVVVRAFFEPQGEIELSLTLVYVATRSAHPDVDDDNP